MTTPPNPTSPVAPALRNRIRVTQAQAKLLLYHKPLRGYTRLMEVLFDRFKRRTRVVGTEPSTTLSYAVLDEDRLGSAPKDEKKCHWVRPAFHNRDWRTFDPQRVPLTWTPFPKQFTWPIQATGWCPQSPATRPHP